MTVDRELADRAAARAKATAAPGARALVRSLHRTPGLREWVTMESVALPPIPVARDGEWSLLSLVTTPKNRSGGSAHAYEPPWGAVRWAWPSGRVAEMRDLRQATETRGLLERDGDTRWSVPADGAALDEVYRRLDAVLSSEPGMADLTPLASALARVLPPSAYPLYWTLAPGSDSWLSPPESAAVTPPATVPAAASTSATPTTPTIPRAGSPLGRWIDDTLALAREFGLASIEDELAELNRRRLLPGFRIAVVGEFNRGKSYLVNRLLGSDLLPTGALPTTSAPTSIVYGTPERMHVRWPDGRREERPLDRSSWADLVTSEEDGSGLLSTRVRCYVDDGWLRDLDAELVDTPGVDESTGERLQLVQDVVNGSDAAIMVMSATAALSMTERAFLENEVLGRHVPRIAVVVSKLDDVDPSDRDAVMGLVADELGRLSPNILVRRGALSDDERPVEELRATVASMAAKSDRGHWRNRQHAGQLLDLLGAAVVAGEEGLAVAALDEQERAAAAARAQNEMEDELQTWNEVRIQLAQRRLDLARLLRDQLGELRGKLVEDLRWELEQQSNPKVWWERDLPRRLRKELTVAATSLDGTLVQRLEADLAWLDERLGIRVSEQAPAPAAEGAGPSGGDPDLRPLQLRDVQRLKLFSRIGGGAAMLVGSLLAPPLGLVFGVGAGVIGEEKLRALNEEQRRVVEGELGRTVDAAIETHSDHIRDRLAGFYDRILDDFDSKRTAWRHSRVEALSPRPEGKSIDWSSLVARASRVRVEISTWLSESAHMPETAPEGEEQ